MTGETGVFMIGVLNRLEVVGAGILRIDSVELSDSGVYVCVLNNTSYIRHLDRAYLNITVIGMYITSISSSSVTRLDYCTK